MGTQNNISLNNFKNHFNCVNYGVLRGFLYKGMIRIGNFIWVLASNCLLFLFGFLDRYLHRLETDEKFGKCDSSSSIEKSEEKGEIFTSDQPRKTENFDVYPGFMFEKRETVETKEESNFGDNTLNTSKYEVSFIKDLSGFVERPKTMSFTVEEMFPKWKKDFIAEEGIEENPRSLAYLGNDFCGNYREKGNEFTTGNDQSFNQISHNAYFGEINLGTSEKTDVQVYLEEFDFGNSEKVIFNENRFSEDAEIENKGSGLGEFRFLSSNLELESSNFTEKEKIEDFVQVLHEETDLENEAKTVSNEKSFLENKETRKSDFSGDFLFSFMNSGIEYSDPMKEVSMIDQKVHPIYFDDKNDFHGVEKCTDAEESILDHSEIFDGENDDEFIELDPNSQFFTTNKGEEKGNIFEDDDDYENDEFDILLQHQENIEKMKMEMKNSKTKGLPTILENCESFKLGEDLKPLKIDEKKLEHKDQVDEIQKVYKSYSDKMRKLDILNYQTLNAISFMQLKDPNHRNLGKKSSTMKSIFPSKQRRVHADPTLKSIFEMHKNLETVYIAQLCLSWETLRWEYEKAKELYQYDSQCVRSYNLVAGEFQQFHVLVQRFIENEQFLGPRVQNYAKNRCDIRIFLQVPIVKEDCLKEKRENSIEGKYEISISMLSDIMEETLHIFWEFLRADHKDENFAKLKGISQNHVDLRDPTDSELLIEIKTNLYMKEKRLKDILRTGNCIVKKFQKQREGRTCLDLLFAQIDLKIVSRVLNMSRLTTDQLIWCQNKLNKVKFSNRKVHVESSFLLFPF